jgi:RND family efflux transporter MFP subunit
MKNRHLSNAIGAASRPKSTARGTLAVLLVLGLAGCGAKHETASSAAPVPVRAAAVAAVPVTASVEAVGSLHSSQEAVLASKVMGNIVEIRKRAGDPVRRGEVLLVIDSQDVSGQIAQAEGALAQARAAGVLAETNLKRFEQLLSRGSASQLEFDQARYQAETARGAVEQAEGAVATARSYRAYAEIPSPFDGRLVDRMCEVGDLAAPGRPLLRVEDAAHLRLDASLDAEKAVAAVPGAEAEVVVPSLGERKFRGIVAEVVPAADPATRSVLVKVDVEADPALRAGVFGRVKFTAGTRQAIVVPRSALRTRGGLTGVFVVEAGRSAFRLVSVAEAAADPVEVLSGLVPGDLVVFSAPPTLEVDVPVEVQR